MDVGDRLRSLGLGQYKATFRDNAIGMDILTELTGNDLGQIGVLFGDRKRLLEAIPSLGSTEPAPKPPIATVLTEPRQDATERRPITVMFCDLVASTSLAAKLDPEDWRNLVGSYLDAASAAVTSLGGHVLKKLGDGLMRCSAIPMRRRMTASAPCARRSRVANVLRRIGWGLRTSRLDKSRLLVSRRGPAAAAWVKVAEYARADPFLHPRTLIN